MKLTIEQLKQLIKEELQATLNEKEDKEKGKIIRDLIFESAVSDADFTYPEMEKKRKEFISDYIESISPQQRDDLENNLVYVHWGFAKNILELIRNQISWNRNQLSAAIYMPGQELKLPGALAGSAQHRKDLEDPIIGVVMRPKRKGPHARMVVIAANADMYSGGASTVTFADKFPKKNYSTRKKRSDVLSSTAKDYEGHVARMQRDSSSGGQKLPYDKEFNPYFISGGQNNRWKDKLIRSSADFDPSAPTNEAIIDNWKPVSIVLPGEKASNEPSGQDLESQAAAHSIETKLEFFGHFAYEAITEGQSELDVHTFPMEDYRKIVENTLNLSKLINSDFPEKGWDTKFRAFEDWLIDNYPPGTFPNQWGEPKVSYKLHDALYNHFRNNVQQIGDKIILRLNIDDFVEKYKDASDY